MKKKDIQRSKFIIGCVCCASILILLGGFGDNERELISNGELIRRIVTGLFLFGLAFFTNKLLDKEVERHERNHSIGINERNQRCNHTDRNNARRSNR